MNDGVPKMRTLEAAFAYVKENDPETALTKYALRQAVLSGELPSVKAGKKYLVNLGILERWMKGENTLSVPAIETNGIRRIDQKSDIRVA